MASALKDWWRRANGLSCVEQGDALYPVMNWGMDWGGGYAVLQLADLLFAWIIARWLGDTSWFGLLWVFALLALVTGLVVLIGYRIERRRFPLGRPLVWKDQDTLTMMQVVYFGSRPYWQSHIRVPLSTLRRITIKTPSTSFWDLHLPRRYVIRFEFSDGEEKIVIPPWVNPAGIDFLRRKLPASVQLTVDGQAPVV